MDEEATAYFAPLDPNARYKVICPDHVRMLTALDFSLNGAIHACRNHNWTFHSGKKIAYINRATQENTNTVVQDKLDTVVQDKLEQPFDPYNTINS